MKKQLFFLKRFYVKAGFCTAVIDKSLGCRVDNPELAVKFDDWLGSLPRNYVPIFGDRVRGICHITGQPTIVNEVDIFCLGPGLAEFWDRENKKWVMHNEMGFLVEDNPGFWTVLLEEEVNTDFLDELTKIEYMR